MKTLFRPFFALVIVAIAFSSCMKDNSAEQEARDREEQQRISSLFRADAEKIRQYRDENPSDAQNGWEEDETDFQLPAIGETPKRGFWFEVLADPIPDEDEEEFKYEFDQNGHVMLPKIRVTYSVSLLDGTEVQAGENREIDLATFGNSNSDVFNGTWLMSFLPKTINYNERDVPTYGLTEKGLRKGSKIRVLAPSYFAFGDRTVGEIPANSPLVYYFDVLEID